MRSLAIMSLSLTIGQGGNMCVNDFGRCGNSFRNFSNFSDFENSCSRRNRSCDRDSWNVRRSCDGDTFVATRNDCDRDRDRDRRRDVCGTIFVRTNDCRDRRSGCGRSWDWDNDWDDWNWRNRSGCFRNFDCDRDRDRDCDRRCDRDRDWDRDRRCRREPILVGDFRFSPRSRNSLFFNDFTNVLFANCRRGYGSCWDD